MGALHAGHRALIDRAVADNDRVVVSIFVNPAQFGPTEDFARYPRNMDADLAMLAAAGVHAAFVPTVETMYPAGLVTGLDIAGPLGARLEGASRPGHFNGVALVVTKLLVAGIPDRAYFGQKDAAQVAVLRHIVRDLNLPVSLVVCPIVRELDGLALSSRNRYLSPAERTRALILSRALRAAEALARAGESSAESLRAAMLAIFLEDPDITLDYAAVVDPDTLLPLADTSRGALLAVAAFVGATRLIDNLLLPPN